MEYLAPPLDLIIEIRHSIEQGNSLKVSIINYLKNHSLSKCTYIKDLQLWFSMSEKGICTEKLTRKIRSPYRRTLLILLERGLKGEPISHQLFQLEEELHQACLQELDRHISLLPVKALVPLIFFLFPGFLILLFGPLLQSLLSHLQ